MAEYCAPKCSIETCPNALTPERTVVRTFLNYGSSDHPRYVTLYVHEVDESHYDASGLYQEAIRVEQDRQQIYAGIINYAIDRLYGN